MAIEPFLSKQCVKIIPGNNLGLKYPSQIFVGQILNFLKRIWQTNGRSDKQKCAQMQKNTEPCVHVKSKQIIIHKTTCVLDYSLTTSILFFNYSRCTNVCKLKISHHGIQLRRTLCSFFACYTEKKYENLFICQVWSLLFWQ